MKIKYLVVPMLMVATGERHARLLRRLHPHRLCPPPLPRVEKDAVSFEKNALDVALQFVEGGIKAIIAESKAAMDRGMTAKSMVDSSFLNAIDDPGFIKANCG